VTAAAGAVGTEIRIPIRSDEDIVAARRQGRSLAATLAFSPVDATLIATAISELARNIVEHARSGEIRLRAVDGDERLGVQVVATDEGPGIPDVGRALCDGFSTSGSLGLGLPGVRRLMDDFQIDSALQRGTTVTVRKWKPE
jgi:serine/threonine-protein kinase RsbT